MKTIDAACAYFAWRTMPRRFVQRKRWAGCVSFIRAEGLIPAVFGNALRRNKGY